MPQQQAQETARVNTPLGDIVAVTQPGDDYPAIHILMPGHDEPIAVIEYDNLKEKISAHLYVAYEDEPVTSVVHAPLAPGE